MKTSVKPLARRAAWKALAAHCKKIKPLDIQPLATGHKKIWLILTVD